MLTPFTLLLSPFAFRPSPFAFRLSPHTWFPRSEQPERMDDRAIVGPELTEALRQLRLINRLLAAWLPTIEGVERLWRAAGRPRTLTVLDVGAGSGDISGHLLRWARRRGVALHLVLADIHPATCAQAAAFHRDAPGVSVLCADVLRLPVQVDIVTAALFLHHFPTAELPAVLGAMARAARAGVVVNDLQRSVWAWLGIWLATRLFSRNRMIRSDAPLSVRRGFRAAELRALRRSMGLGGLRWWWRPLFRYLMVLES
jgi:SAM-dependent methyltransferase